MNRHRASLPYLVCLALAGCGDAVTAGAAHEAPDAALALGPQLDFDTARERAAALGEALARPIEALRGTDEPLEVAVERLFGPAVDGREVDGWLDVGGAFRYRPGQCDGLATAESPSGRSAIVLASPDASLFYEWTVIETDTGRLYQSVGQISAGCDTGSIRWFGPFAPGDGAAITGDFSEDERSNLSFAIADGLRSALEPAR